MRLRNDRRQISRVAVKHKIAVVYGFFRHIGSENFFKKRRYFFFAADRIDRQRIVKLVIFRRIEIIRAIEICFPIDLSASVILDILVKQYRIIILNVQFFPFGQQLRRLFDRYYIVGAGRNTAENTDKQQTQQ